MVMSRICVKYPLLNAWELYTAERSVSLSATSLSTDYALVYRWLERCPHQKLDQGRLALTWVCGQEPKYSALRVAMYLKALFRWASSPDVALVASNPVASFKLPKRPQRPDEVTVIQRSEIPFVIAALERQDATLPRWDLWAQLQLQTGLRTGEVRAIRAQDVEAERLYVHSNYTTNHGLKDSTKTNRPRWVPLNHVARGILDGLTADADGFLFPWNRSSFQDFFRIRMQGLYKQRLISTTYRPYDLRHTAISGWLEAGVPVAQVAQWAGNTAEVIWRHYASTTVEYQMPVLA